MHKFLLNHQLVLFQTYHDNFHEVLLHNLINEYNPDFIAYGSSGFRGYIVFGFCKKNLFFLESIFPNNATYIFESDWEELSKLTKSEILNHNLQKGRLIHNANWPTEFEKYMNANG